MSHNYFYCISLMLGLNLWQELEKMVGLQSVALVTSVSPHLMVETGPQLTCKKVKQMVTALELVWTAWG